jgi:hypothetical protein
MSDVWGDVPEEMAWTCTYCDGPQKFRVVRRQVHNPDENEAYEPFETVVVECSRCSMPYILMSEAEPDGSASPLEQRYPTKIAPLSSHVPMSIRSAHVEAVRCFEIRAHTAVTLLARRGVEAICADHDKRDGTLARKLNELKEEGVIDDRLLEWSTVVRDLGNSGAHDVESGISREDADDALAFFEALVNYLYTFRRRYEIHRARRELL